MVKSKVKTNGYLSLQPFCVKEGKPQKSHQVYNLKVHESMVRHGSSYYKSDRNNNSSTDALHNNQQVHQGANPVRKSANAVNMLELSKYSEKSNNGSRISQNSKSSKNSHNSNFKYFRIK